MTIPIYTQDQLDPERLLIRTIEKSGVADTVRDIIATVASRGDEALFSYCETFDGAKLTDLQVSDQEIQAAYDRTDPELIRVLERAAENIRAFHRPQLPKNYELQRPDGSRLGVVYRSIEKVGICIPGRTAAYPSSVLMTAIPAGIAGCRDITMVSPPHADGTLPDAILTAAKIAGVTRIFKIGGAQAVAAMAYGTESVPKVDKIVGPGSAFVAEAKRQVFGLVDIDMVAGPSEILVLADESCDPAFVAADLLSQAEHDVLASAILLTDSRAVAQAVQEQVERQLATLPRADITRQSLENNGKIILTQTLADALDLANTLAPEHLELCVENPMDYLPQVKNAGSIFLGNHTPESLGDYLSGTNHTLPTCGAARFSSPLGVMDYIKASQYTQYTPQGLESMSQDIARFARQEGLEAHARAALIRFDKEI
jgi:histidinol dehydrogenase